MKKMKLVMGRYSKLCVGNYWTVNVCANLDFYQHS